ncbi:MAG: hypothetical protein KJO91_12335, partial [Gammaproteobacteria bacterium]|nr:hypothetical protein [Gammaproteobacteria bacterium]
PQSILFSPALFPQVDVTGGGGGPGGAFTDLSDTPGTYAGAANTFIKVNAGESGLQFIADPGYLTDVAWGDIVGPLAAQTDLQSALDNKSAVGHTHVKADITDFAHSHNISDVSGLQASLDSKVDKAGDIMNSGANLTFQGGGEPLGLPAIPSASAATSKEYVDSLISGQIWLDPILDPDVVNINANTPPVTPVTRNEAFILGTTPTGVWNVFLPGEVVAWDGSGWQSILGRPIENGDRFGVEMEPTSYPSPNLDPSLSAVRGKIITITDNTPGAVTYDNFTPDQNDTVFVNNELSLHFAHTYTFNGTWGVGVYGTGYKWLETGSPVSIVAGNFLAFTGNVLNVTENFDRIIDGDGDTHIKVDNNPGADSDRITMAVGNNNGLWTTTDVVDIAATGGGSGGVKILAPSAVASSDVNGISIEVRGGAGDGGGEGGEIEIIAGAGGSDANGGDITIESGAGGTDPGNDGGAIDINAGGSAGGDGGEINIVGGDSAADYSGGEVYIESGRSSRDGDSGNIVLDAASCNGTGGTGNGYAGSIDISAGTGFNGAYAGYVDIRAGQSLDAAAPAGYVSIRAGNAVNAGGTVTIKGGNASGTNANDQFSNVDIEAGDAATGNGGSINLTPGDGGTPGAVKLQPYGAGPTVADLRFYHSAGPGEYVGFKSPADVSAGITGDGNSTVWTLPEGDGTDGQSLTTDGLGVLRWATPAGLPADEPECSILVTNDDGEWHPRAPLELCRPYDVAAQIFGVTPQDAAIFKFVTPQKFKLLDYGHQLDADTPPTAATVAFDVTKNGTSVGTMTFDQTTGTSHFDFGIAAGGNVEEFEVGDIVRIVSPNVDPTGLEDVSLVLRGIIEPAVKCGVNPLSVAFDQAVYTNADAFFFNFNNEITIVGTYTHVEWGIIGVSADNGTTWYSLDDEGNSGIPNSAAGVVINGTTVDSETQYVEEEGAEGYSLIPVGGDGLRFRFRLSIFGPGGMATTTVEVEYQGY